jgi:hypothetical protein
MQKAKTQRHRGANARAKQTLAARQCHPALRLARDSALFVGPIGPIRLVRMGKKIDQLAAIR